MVFATDIEGSVASTCKNLGLKRISHCKCANRAQPTPQQTQALLVHRLSQAG